MTLAIGVDFGGAAQERAPNNWEMSMILSVISTFPSNILPVTFSLKNVFNEAYYMHLSAGWVQLALTAFVQLTIIQISWLQSS